MERDGIENDSDVATLKAKYPIRKGFQDSQTVDSIPDASRVPHLDHFYWRAGSWAKDGAQTIRARQAATATLWASRRRLGQSIRGGRVRTGLLLRVLI